jgi:alpha-D-ribose 1-methylphosphonate 5-triphosphate diphosphatase
VCDRAAVGDFVLNLPKPFTHALYESAERIDEMNDYAIHNVTAVTPSDLIEDACVVVENGIITELTSMRGHVKPTGSIDGRGAYLLPGLVDVHSDGLEKELSPRPGVHFPEAFALRSFEGRLRGAGVTTVLHGVGYEKDVRHGRTVDLAHRLTEILRERRADENSLVDHRILYRIDARDPEGVVALSEHLDDIAHEGEFAHVSFEDHTPGQGQYANVDAYKTWLESRTEEVDAELQRVIAARSELLANKDPNLRMLCGLARQGRIRLLIHDPTTAEEIMDASGWPASIAEFPTTIEAASAAMRCGMPTVLGAPNVMRGGSHSGNVSAEELVRLNLVSCLASDYQPATMLAAAFLLAQRNACTLPHAVRLITDGPANVLQLGDRGRLEVGYRADLALCDFDGSWPSVRQTWRAFTPSLVGA